MGEGISPKLKCMVSLIRVELKFSIGGHMDGGLGAMGIFAQTQLGDDAAQTS